MKEDAAPNPVTGNVLVNDSDPDGNSLSVTNAGTFTTNYGTLVINADGSYGYTLDDSDPQVNALNDGRPTDRLVHLPDLRRARRQRPKATLTVTINGSTDNHPPVAVDDAASVKEDAAPNPVTGNVLVNDSDPDGNSLSVTNAGTFTTDYRDAGDLDADGSYGYTLDDSNPQVNALNDGQH